jgi:D-lyxose ketol-isomerase
MKQLPLLERRTVCAALLGLGIGPLTPRKSKAAPQAAPDPSPASLRFQHRDFYDTQGNFDEQAARRAYFALMQHAGYPVSPSVRENLWVAEFGLGRFTNVGLGGAFWVNSKEWNYASVEIFLLPGQMIPEHWHVALEDQGVVPKMESWIVRYGAAFAYGEGDPAANARSRVPPAEAHHVTAWKETVLEVGQVAGLSRPEEKHSLLAGPQGAILSEVSTFHSAAAVRFTNPNAKL